MRLRPLLVAALLATLGSATSASAESSTIRIEPRPYYGAVVTLEQGVRVWRPLPPTRHMIINPTGAPVSVNLTDVRETIVQPAYQQPLPSANHAQGDHGYGYGPGYFGTRARGFQNQRFRRSVGGIPVRRAAIGRRP